MGIQGLLPLLKSIMLPIHIRDLKGCSVAIDTYSWLHKGALSCSKDLCKGLATSKHIHYCMHRVNLLRHYGVKPILVFDGGLLPMKGEQENKRERARRENMSRAMEHESNGNLTAAYECYQKAVDISPSVAYDLIQVLKQENICYVVAPYEADAQMTFLAVSKQVDAVITEDSDLIAFGCPRIIYKMDKFGQGVEFHYSMLQQNKELDFKGFTNQMVLEMCILSGCDYLQSLPGMGLKRAHALIKKFKSYDKVLKHLKCNGIAVSPLYEESFKKAILTFQYQRVYNPLTEDIVHLSELPGSINANLDFLGPMIPQNLAEGIATGDLDPFTKMPLEGRGAELALNENHQLKTFKPEGERKKPDLPVQKNLLTNYFCFASLEAKREFKIPRNTPKLSKSNHGRFGTTVDVNPEANSDNMINSTTGLLESVEYNAAITASNFLESKSYGADDIEDIEEDKGTEHKMSEYPIYKPCTALHKEHMSDPNHSRVRAENANVIVRSSYFVHKSMLENNQFEKNGKDETGTDDCGATIANLKYRSSLDDSEKKQRAVKKNVIVRSSYFQPKSTKESVQYDKCAKPSVKETAARYTGNSFVYDKIGGKNTIDGGNDVERNLCFLQNSICKSSQYNKYEKLLVENGRATKTEETAVPEFSAISNEISVGLRKKRKVTFADNVETDKERKNDLLEDAVHPIESDFGSSINDANVETKACEGKFGCNISHLGHYSEIAEKSMENFVSVISSFRFTSSGSRASGLRAPLKDIKNTCSSRSSSNMDIRKFAYAPAKRERTTRRRV